MYAHIATLGETHAFDIRRDTRGDGTARTHVHVRGNANLYLALDDDEVYRLHAALGTAIKQDLDPGPPRDDAVEPDSGDAAATVELTHDAAVVLVVALSEYATARLDRADRLDDAADAADARGEKTRAAQYRRLAGRDRDLAATADDLRTQVDGQQQPTLAEVAS